MAMRYVGRADPPSLSPSVLKRVVVPWAVTCVVSAAGCGAEDLQRPTTWAERDSAGIRIVESSEPAWTAGEGWRVTTSPRLEVAEDASDPDGVWSDVRSVFRWEDGRLGIITADAPHLRVYDPDGRELYRAGPAGEGPGEVGLPVWGAPVGDSAVVHDPLRGALFVYGPGGSFVRRVPLPPTLAGEGGEMLAPAAHGGAGVGGWIALDALPALDPAHGGEVTSTTETVALLLRPDGTLGDTLGRAELLNTYRVQGALWGELRHAATDGRALHVLHPERFEIRSYRDGALRRIARAPVPSMEAFTEEHFEVTRGEWGALADRFIRSDRERGRLVPPPAVALLPGPDGTLWARRTDDGPGADVQRWDVFDRNGVWRGPVETPGRLRIEEIGEDAFVGVWRDEFDVASVRVYGLER